MDLNLSPQDGEQVKWYTAIIGFLTATVVGLVAKFWNRHEKETDHKDEQFERRVDESGRRLIDLELRLVRLEAREVITKEDIEHIADKIFSHVDKQHGAITNRVEGVAARVEACALAINARVDSLVTAINSKPGHGEGRHS